MIKKFQLSLVFTLLNAVAFTQGGYQIKLTFKPFKNQYVYLGHYFGKTYPIIDSALLDANSTAVFKGNKNLQGGIYLIGYPNKAGFFEILIDKNQQFSITADTASLPTGIKFENSTDNVLFAAYQKNMVEKGRAFAAMQQQLKAATTKKDSSIITEKITAHDKEVMAYRDGIIKNNPDNILSQFLISMKEPILTGRLKNPVNKEDSIASYNYFKTHFWDGVYFWDGRLAYTPFFEDKVEKYYSQLVQPHPDSTIKEIDRMLGEASANEEMTRFLLIKFINRYLNQKYMWEDAVFVHLFEKYVSNKEYKWLTKEGRKIITDRAYSLMANIMGTPASDIVLPDINDTVVGLYDVKASYTLLAFWDPTCGHCKEVLPKLDSIYNAKWKGYNLKIFALAKETEGNKKDWLDFIAKHKLADWYHVYYAKEDDKLRTSNGIPSYSQLFDIQSFPTLYLLDKDKRIIAKKLSYEQIDEILQLKLKGE
jgi:thiol-disulfide isomerase/thioredoxin